jgi:hypothetical protein
MAATRVIEEERGTITGSPRNPHQGYYAGDFSGLPRPVSSGRPVAGMGYGSGPRSACMIDTHAVQGAPRGGRWVS